MSRESLSNADWLRIVDRLGGAELLEEEARELGAFQRARKVEYAVDHLRLVLAYCWSSCGCDGRRLHLGRSIGPYVINHAV